MSLTAEHLQRHLHRFLSERYGRLDGEIIRSQSGTELTVTIGRARVEIGRRKLLSSEPGALLEWLTREIDEQLKPRPYHLNFRPGRKRTRLGLPRQEHFRPERTLYEV